MWDLALDLQTGDLVFNANLDLASVVDYNVITQRIHTRLFIERGGYIYDDSGRLGSRLGTIGLRLPMDKSHEILPGLVREALEPMDDIIITEIEVHDPGEESVIEQGMVHLVIHYTPHPTIGGQQPQTRTASVDLIA